MPCPHPFKCGLLARHQRNARHGTIQVQDRVREDDCVGEGSLSEHEDQALEPGIYVKARRGGAHREPQPWRVVADGAQWQTRQAGHCSSFSEGPCLEKEVRDTENPGCQLLTSTAHTHACMHSEVLKTQVWGLMRWVSD